MQANVQNSVAQSGMPHIPLVNSTQVLTTSSPILNSQVNQVNPVVSTTGVDPTQVNQQVTVSYAPIVSALNPQPAPGQRPKVTVVPIYDE